MSTILANQTEQNKTLTIISEAGRIYKVLLNDKDVDELKMWMNGDKVSMDRIKDESNFKITHKLYRVMIIANWVI